MKKFLAILIAFTLTLSHLPIAGAAMDNFTAVKHYNNQFRDVPENSWYAPYVKKTYELGLISGKTEDTFAPQSNITLAEVIAVAARINAQYFGNAIPETGGAWYQRYIEYGVEQGYMRDSWLVPTADSDMNKPVDRWECAYMLSCVLPKEAFEPLNEVSNIPDLPLDSNSKLDVYAIYLMYAAGILSGSGFVKCFVYVILWQSHILDNQRDEVDISLPWKVDASVTVR